MQYTYQKSTTDLGTKLDERVKWTDDKINRVIPYVSFIHNGADSVLYHKHSLTFAHKKDVMEESDNATLYNFNLIELQTLNAKSSAQIGGAFFVDAVKFFC